jgi:hypothetical protein
VIKLVKAAGGSGNDGIAYTFFSFGNVSSIANSASYGYLTLDGQDAIGLTTLFPNQELPNCASYPCPERGFAPWISGTTLQSFPAMRSGKYTAWSLLRMVTNSTHEVLVEDLAKQTFAHVVNETPDYIPVDQTTDSAGNIDPGLIWWHTHYQQRDANGTALGGAPANGTFPTHHNPSLVAGDHGGDMGGCTITTTGITGTTKLKYIQSNVVEPYAVTCALDRN